MRYVVQLNYFDVSETKFDNSFPSAQLMLGVYKLRTRRDRDKNGSGLTEYVRRGVICRRLKQLQIAISKTICSELTIAKRKWLCMRSTDHQIIII